jgi:hypothetical protein
MVHVSSDHFNRCILADAKEVDVMIRDERTTATIPFTSIRM